MSEPCSNDISEAVHNLFNQVKNEIQECIWKYMSFEETVKHLYDKHKFGRHVTEAFWEQFQIESPDFFKLYNLSLEIARQIKFFNSLLRTQSSLMFQHGELNINTASHTLVNFLAHDPEGTLLLDKLADTPSDRLSEESPSISEMLALSDTGIPTVNQLQIPNGQREQFHHYQCSVTPNDCNDLGAPTFAAQPTDQWFTSNDITLNQFETPNGQPNQLHQKQWSTLDDLPCNLGAHPTAPAASNHFPISNDLSDHYPAFSTAPSVAQAPTVLDGLSTFDFGDNIENGCSYFNVMDPSFAQQLTQYPFGQHQLPYQQQQNFSLEDLELLQYEVTNNHMQYGGNNNELQYVGNDNELQAVIPQQQQQQQHHQEQETIHAKAERHNQIHES